MSRRRKLEKFESLLGYPHVYEMVEPGSPLVKKSLNEELDMRGKWSSAFPTSQPICLELACGRGEYTVALAREHKDINYLGVDIKGARIYQGATISLEEGLDNAGFLRIRIEQIANYFAPGEVDHIWITFPDPFPAKANRRLTAPALLEKYHQILRPGGIVNFKTDDDALFEYSLEVAAASTLFRLAYASHDIYSSPLYLDELEIKTYYEKKHLNAKKTIKYLQLVRND